MPVNDSADRGPVTQNQNVCEKLPSQVCTQHAEASEIMDMEHRFVRSLDSKVSQDAFDLRTYSPVREMIVRSDDE